MANQHSSNIKAFKPTYIIVTCARDSISLEGKAVMEETKAVKMLSLLPPVVLKQGQLFHK